MRCIEIFMIFPEIDLAEWLIETWDVLKSNPLLQGILEPRMINRNMRCIEIWGVWVSAWARYGLIETWDVLKFSVL